MTAFVKITAGLPVPPSFEQAWDDLLLGKKSGHMGVFEFEDESLPVWQSLLMVFAENYYPLENEKNLISNIRLQCQNNRPRWQNAANN